MYDDLAEEILQQSVLQLDYVFVGVETGSTISRLAKALKAEKPEIKVYGVEPVDSVFAGNESSQHHRRRVGQDFSHKCHHLLSYLFYFFLLISRVITV